MDIITKEELEKEIEFIGKIAILKVTILKKKIMESQKLSLKDKEHLLKIIFNPSTFSKNDIFFLAKLLNVKVKIEANSKRGKVVFIFQEDRGDKIDIFVEILERKKPFYCIYEYTYQEGVINEKTR